MSTETVLNRVVQHERRHPGHLLELGNGFAQVFFLEMIQVERIELFEDRLQIAFQASRRLHGIGQSGKDLAELGHRCHADFVPVKELLLALGKSLIGQLGGTILQQRRIEDVLQERSRRLCGFSVVVFFERGVQLGDRAGSVACGHSELRFWQVVGWILSSSRRLKTGDPHRQNFLCRPSRDRRHHRHRLLGHRLLGHRRARHRRVRRRPLGTLPP